MQGGRCQNCLLLCGFRDVKASRLPGLDTPFLDGCVHSFTHTRENGKRVDVMLVLLPTHLSAGKMSRVEEANSRRKKSYVFQAFFCRVLSSLTTHEESLLHRILTGYVAGTTTESLCGKKLFEMQAPSQNKLLIETCIWEDVNRQTHKLSSRLSLLPDLAQPQECPGVS